jgi:hypothetical protein
VTAAPLVTPSETVEPEAVSEDSAPAAPESGAVTANVAVASEEPGWPDAAAESAFLAEAKSRGEVPAPKPATVEEVEEAESEPLPPMDKMVERVPPPVREMLDDLFRARFVRVTRIPRRALKS